MEVSGSSDEDNLGSSKAGKTPNSQEFPDKEARPQMFRDDRLFDRLTFENAARVMWEHSQVEEKKKEQQRKKKDYEKADDKLLLLDIPAGKDIGIDVVCEARRLLARPLNKEIKDQMNWLPTSYKAVIRNLPLSVFCLVLSRRATTFPQRLRSRTSPQPT